MLIFSEAHLRRVLSAYAAYYSQARARLALQKDAPLKRSIRRVGRIATIPMLAGMHHQYVDTIFGKVRSFTANFSKCLRYSALACSTIGSGNERMEAPHDNEKGRGRVR